MTAQAQFPPHELRYRRTFDADAGDSIAKLARWIGDGACVLDLGVGEGALGAHLVANRGCTFDGVERDPAMAANARERGYRAVFEADLDGRAIDEIVGDNRYDIVLCADVLEHLKEPERVLASLVPLLRPKGRILISVPNFTYAACLAELIGGGFHYRDGGILDSTHLRVFTRPLLAAMIERCGLRPVAVDAVVSQPRNSEFDLRHFEALPGPVRDHLRNLPDAATYQFLAAAMAAGAADEEDVVRLEDDVRTEPARIDFMTKAYWCAGHEPFDEARSASVLGEVGLGRQSLRVPLPPMAAISALRWDPGERPGVMRLYTLAMVDFAEHLVWRWTGDPPSRPPHEMTLRTVAPGEADLELLGDDPYLVFEVPEAVRDRLVNGGALVIDIDAIGQGSPSVDTESDTGARKRGGGLIDRFFRQRTAR